MTRALDDPPGAARRRDRLERLLVGAKRIDRGDRLLGIALEKRRRILPFEIAEVRALLRIARER